MGGLWEGKYYDGKTAESKEITIQLHAQGLHLLFPDEPRRFWVFEDIRIFSQGVKSPVRVEKGDFPIETIVISNHDFLREFNHLAPHAQKQTSIFTLPGKRRFLYLGILVLFLIVAIPSLIKWGIPPLARLSVKAVPLSLETELGDHLFDVLMDDKDTCSNREGDRLLTKFVDQIMVPDSKYPFQITIVDTSRVNAIALPGGRILVFRGLLELAPSPEALAGVIAHEMQHILHQHGLQNIFKSLALSGMFTLIAGEGGEVLELMLEGIEVISFLSYSRQSETEADLEGLRQILDAGVDPQGMLEMYRLLQAQGAETSSFEAYFLSHPDMDQRLQRMQEILQTQTLLEPRSLLASQDWETIKHICMTE